MQLVQFGHLFFLEVLDLFLGLRQLLINGALLTLHSLLLVLEIANVELDAFLLVIKVKTGITQALNLVNLGVLAELRVEVVIVIIVVFLLDFLLFGLFTVFVTLAIVLLDLLRSSSLLRDLLIEGEDLFVMLVIRVDEVVELCEKLGFLLLDIFDFLTLADELARDFLDLLDDESLGLSALFELV